MDPWDSKRPRNFNKKPPANIDELIDRLQKQFKMKFFNNSMIPLVTIGIVVVWLLSGFFTVEPNQQAVIKRFGVPVGVVGAGPHYHLPFPIETVMKQGVTNVRRIEIGFRTIQKGPPARYRSIPQESTILTGDENIVNVEFIVQYHINDLEQYFFNDSAPDNTVKAVAESSMRYVIGHTNVDDAITTGKRDIEDKTKLDIQSILNSYKIGIKIDSVKLQDVHPPEQVKDAFKDVASAKEDSAKKKNEAQGYKNNLIPRSRGEAKKIINEALAYEQKITLLAKGEAKRFESVLKEYKKAKAVTKKRISIETMETVLPKINPVLADPSLGKNVLPFLPIDRLAPTK